MRVFMRLPMNCSMHFSTPITLNATWCATVRGFYFECKIVRDLCLDSDFECMIVFLVWQGFWTYFWSDFWTFESVLRGFWTWFWICFCCMNVFCFGICLCRFFFLVTWIDFGFVAC